MDMSTQNEGSAFQQKLCIATLMDMHPNLFVGTVPERSWAAFVESGISPSGLDRRSIDKALGMVSAVFRSAQLAMSDRPTPGQLFATLEPETLEKIPPADPLTLEMIGPDAEADHESLALARLISIYKKAAGAGLVDCEFLALQLDAALDEQPEHTALARDVKATARQIAALQMTHLLRDVSSPES